MDKIVNKSYWLDSVNRHNYVSLDMDIETDALIIGGGMVGITTAYLLSLEGIRTTIIEGNTLFSGASGNTTAKLTSQHGLIYDKLISGIGEEKARLYAEANENAIKSVKKIIKNNNIHCDLLSLPAYVFTEQDSSIDNIEKEALAAQKLGINASFTNELNIPFKVKAAVMFHNQAQFHPAKYLNELAKLYIINGGQIYENTRAKSLDTGDIHTIITTNGKIIKAKYVIIATHFPFYDGLGLYFTRLYPERSYIIGLKIKEDFPNGMYITAECPKLSLRSQPMNGEKLILFGGESHKTGDGIPTTPHYIKLLEQAEKHYTVLSNPYRWSAQDYNTPDGMPYIGELSSSSKNIYVATGFAKWGMTTSMVSATMIKDLIINGDSPYKIIFNPSRISLKAATTTTFIKESVNVAKNLIKGKLNYIPDDIEVNKGEGKVVIINNKKYGAYRDEEGKLHIVDTTCTHVGCECRWNDAEKTWDCPCHGSRFNIDGNIIEGPAHNPLNKENHRIEPNIK